MGSLLPKQEVISYVLGLFPKLACRAVILQRHISCFSDISQRLRHGGHLGAVSSRQWSLGLRLHMNLKYKMDINWSCCA